MKSATTRNPVVTRMIMTLCSVSVDMTGRESMHTIKAVFDGPESSLPCSGESIARRANGRYIVRSE